jgi:hypothetical protein
MGYRRPETDSITSQRWRIDHKAELMECGVPFEIANSDRSWTYWLLHGEDHLGTGWQPAWITASQAKRLLSLIEKEIGESSGYNIVQALLARCQEKDDPL